jgi:small subunit ribosomal protein S18
MLSETEYSRSRSKAKLTAAADAMRALQVSNDYMSQMQRRWKSGDVYGPRDLSRYEARMWGMRRFRKVDVLDVLGVNPKDNYWVSHGTSEC